MRCKKCGTILLDTDTYCGKCGTKVVLDICPKCGETLRPGMRFCSSCGYEVKHIEDISNELEDDDIPVVNQVKTVDIPFDIIEENIIRDVEKQLDPPNTTRKVKKIEVLPEYDDEVDSEEDYEEEYEEYEDSDYEEYDNSEYDDEYEDSYDYVEEDEEETTSTFSRLVTAGMIVVGLILVLMIALFFFKNRKEKEPNEPTQVIQETNTEDDNTNNIDSSIGDLVIIKNVNIRDLPSTEGSNVLGVAKEGEEYKYYGYAEDNQNWVHIKIDDNSDGYVYKDYVEFK